MNFEFLPKDLILLIASYCEESLWYLSRTNTNNKLLLLNHYKKKARYIDSCTKSPYVYRFIRVYSKYLEISEALFIIDSFETKFSSLQSLYLLNNVTSVLKNNNTVILSKIINIMVKFAYNLDSFKKLHSKFLISYKKKSILETVEEACKQYKTNREDIINFLNHEI